MDRSARRLGIENSNVYRTPCFNGEGFFFSLGFAFLLELRIDPHRMIRIVQQALRGKDT